MATALTCALTEMAALEQEVNSLMRLNPEKDNAILDTALPCSVAASSPTGKAHDFSKSKREEIAQVGSRITQTSSQNAMTWGAWHRLGRFTNEINPQAYLGRIDRFFDKTTTVNAQGLKEIEEVFDEVWQLDKTHAQKTEEALVLLRNAREIIESLSH
jgi:hypothetical protein